MNPISRRRLLMGGLAGAAAGVGWLNWAPKNRAKADVFIARNQRYNGDLRTVIAEGLQATGARPAEFKGKRVLLKPNLIEPVRGLAQITTHPAVVVAAAEVFRSWGAQVSIGEGPGHLRDTRFVLSESGFDDVLRELRIPFSDLNYEDTRFSPLVGGFSKLEGFHLPQSVLEADIVVSMPKMKTHHWVGVTGAMKNLYGVLPGIAYGWPKNVLHFHGIPQTVCDVNQTLGAITIVDGIVGMEGDGPIMGTAVDSGLIVIGTNAPAVDATLCRLMDLPPERIPYLALAAGRLGPIHESSIRQRGESITENRRSFAIHNAPHLAPLVAHRTKPG